MSKIDRKYTRLQNKKENKKVVYKYDGNGNPIYATKKQIRKSDTK